MNAAATSQHTPVPQAPMRAQGRMDVPIAWRIGQAIAIGLIALLALYYNLVGWRVSSGAPPSRTLFDQLGFVILAALVWQCTPAAGVIAMATLHEALRRRWIIAMLIFSLLLLGASTFFTGLQPGEEERFLRDFGIGFIITMTLLMSIFLGIALVPPEIERRTIFTILSKPVTRVEFVLGKFFGLAATLLLNLVLMSAIFLISYAIFQIRREGWSGAMAMGDSHPGLSFDLKNLAYALVLHFGQLCVMASLALLLSLIVTNITAIVFCFLAYFGGQMSSYWEQLGSGARNATEQAPGLSKPMQGVVSVLYYALPRLDRFDVRESLVNDTPVVFSYVWKAWGSGLIYVAILLLIACLVFSDREF